MKYLKKFESMVHKSTLDQMRKVSKALGNVDIGKRVDDSSFANALKNTKRDITSTNVQTYSDYMNEPFVVNQNRKPWKKRKNKKK